MYESFFGLRERPFGLAPDPRFLFLASSHREALSMLRYGLSTPRGLTLLLGEAGTGKTTLVQAALNGLNGTRYVLMTSPTLRRDEFYEFLAHGFGMSEGAASSKVKFLLEFQRALETWYRPGRPSALVIDEAQALSNELLEEVRLLTNFENQNIKLLNIVLTGQRELGERLNQVSLCQLKQRVALRCALAPLNLYDTASYIAGRLRRAGASPGEVFTRSAVIRIFEASGGIPRTINVLCDNAMLGGFGAGQKPVDRDMVDAVCRDFDLRTPAGLVPEAVGRNAPAARATDRATGAPAPAPTTDAQPPATGPQASAPAPSRPPAASRVEPRPRTAGAADQASQPAARGPAGQVPKRDAGPPRPAGARSVPDRFAPVDGGEVDEMFSSITKKRRFSLFGR